MLYHPKIATKFIEQPTPDSGLEVRAIKVKSHSDRFNLVIGRGGSGNGVFTKLVMPDVPIAWSDGSLRDAQVDTFSSFSDVLKAAFMLNKDVDMFHPVETPPGGCSSWEDFFDRAMVAFTRSSTSSAEAELPDGTVYLSFFFSWELYTALVLRAPEVAGGGEAASGSILQVTAPRAVEHIFGTDELALIKMVESDFEPLAGVSDDLDEGWFAHKGDAVSSVRNSRGIWLAKCGPAGLSPSDNNRFRTYTKTSVPNARFQSMGLPDAANPCVPKSSRNWPTTRWGNGVIKDLNDRKQRRKRFSYAGQGDQPTYDQLLNQLADVEYLGKLAAIRLMYVMREYECLDLTWMYDAYASGVLSSELRTPVGTPLNQMNEYAQQQTGTTWQTPYSSMRARGLLMSLGDIQDTKATMKQIVKQDEAVSSSLAINADFVHVSFTRGVIATADAASRWYEPYQQPTPNHGVNNTLLALANAYVAHASHGEDTDTTNFSYEQWWMSVDGSHGAWSGFRSKDDPSEGGPFFSALLEYWGDLFEVPPDLTVDNMGVASFSKYEGLLSLFGIGEGFWAPATNGASSTVLPGAVTFILGSDEGNGLIISTKKWKGTTSTWLADDDYTGYLLGRSYA